LVFFVFPSPDPGYGLQCPCAVANASVAKRMNQWTEQWRSRTSAGYIAVVGL